MGIGRIVTLILVIVIISLAGITVVLASSNPLTTKASVTFQNSSQAETTITKTQTRESSEFC